MAMSDEFGDAPTEIEVAVYALRTFGVAGDRLTSVAKGDGHWNDGVCVARCTANPDDPQHVPPADNCGCGVYGFFTLEELFAQYGAYAHRVVGVIAAQGLTAVGDKGLKTAAARIVAYWCRDDDRDITVCELSCPGARRFYDVDVLARLYGLNEKTRQEIVDGS
jgi:hypothetical protein